MCDCPADKEDGSRKVPETVTLFKKCAKSYRPTKDITEPPSCDTISDKDIWSTADSSQSDHKCTIYGSQSSSNSFSTCSKVYKFVDFGECECLGEAEEEPWHPPIFSYEPCVEEEEVEERPDIECTLAIIKPEAIIYRKQIEQRIFEEGFEIYQTRWLQLTPEQVSEFYSDKYGQLNFAYLVAYMASEPIIVHVLAKKCAVHEWRLLMGPTKVTEARLYYPDSIRARYGRRGEDFKNAVHGSNTRQEAEKEIHFFFPDFIVEPLLKNQIAVDYLWEVLNPVLVEALSTCCKLKPADPVLWLANWLIMNNPNKPKLPQDLAMIPS
ncbi:nucleoside diphosphate kinase homolog 5 isoform X3 [Bombus vancouverensis nearcticus]|uniref:nucleoside diphosphate kinase homolog 5 isoform X3 n=1 Tax=Bombus vancouverensis nearcticus TaxID=2705178 RepID=UPI00143AA49D|nr:nucleoside diphosphate kinase homolog 5-like isoform X3 [Bombus vancouverensis nearcticus]